MVSSLLTRPAILPAFLLRKNPLPAPFLGRVRVFTAQCVRHQNATPAVGQVALVDRLDGSEMLSQRRLERHGEHGDPVLGALTVADEYFVAREIDALHTQAQAFHQAQSRAIHQRGHEPFVAGQVRQHGLYFFPGHHDGQAFGLAGADDSAQIANFAPEHMALEKQQSAKRLVLRRGADLLLDGQIGQKGVDFRFGHFGGMAHLVKEDVPLDPLAIGLSVRLSSLRTNTDRPSGVRPVESSQIASRLESEFP